jgi:uncharacterized protein (TIGR02001 family)
VHTRTATGRRTIADAGGGVREPRRADVAVAQKLQIRLRARVPHLSGDPMNNMKLAAVAAAALCFASFARAADDSDWSITGNAGLYSDYRFRGISQTNKKPAFQGGYDVAHKSGFYVGNWNSNVDSAFYNGANLEMDFYGGYKPTFGDIALDVGILYYYYPGSGANNTNKIDNTEIYLGGTWGPVSLKYSHATSDFFGVPDSKNSYYLDGTFSYDIGNGLGAVAHVGYQKLKGGARITEIGGTTLEDSIVDYKIGVTYGLAGFTLGAAYVATNRDITGGTALATNRNLSNGTVVLSLGKTF